jgi:hypothetical protein
VNKHTDHVQHWTAHVDQSGNWKPAPNRDCHYCAAMDGRLSKTAPPTPSEEEQP